MLKQALSYTPRWLAALAATAACAVQAQVVTVVYEPAPVIAAVATPVPSLTTWGLLILASVVGFVAFKRLRLGKSAKHWAVLLGLAVVLAAGSGGMVVNQAMAVAASTDMDMPAGGNIPVGCNAYNAETETRPPTILANVTSVTQTVVSITPDADAGAQGTGWTTTCEVGKHYVR